MPSLEQRVTELERLMRQHLGVQQGSINANTPHPALSAASRGQYNVANAVPDRSFDADTAVVAELADVVATLISDLQSTRLLG